MTSIKHIQDQLFIALALSKFSQILHQSRLIHRETIFDLETTGSKHILREVL